MISDLINSDLPNINISVLEILLPSYSSIVLINQTLLLYYGRKFSNNSQFWQFQSHFDNMKIIE